MNQQQYLKTLKQHLTGLPYDEITEILADIQEHFETAVANGRTESEVAEALGAPKLMALGLMTQSSIQEDKVKPMAKGISVMRLWMIFVGVGFTNLLLLPLFIGIAGVIFGLFVTILALYFSGGMLIIAPLLKMISANLVSTGPFPVTLLPILGIGLIYGTRRLHIAFNIIAKRLFSYGLKFTKFSWQALRVK